MLVLAIDLFFTAHTLNSAGWLLGRSTIQQTITFRDEVSKNRSHLNMRTRPREIHMINWFIPTYIHEKTTYNTK